ncbi:hypothetical protein B0T25DRAFT_560728 [Lasiosphaeria hispida]|uniref:Uncharacterized protein n=1 Tax=Lasiosphaeria hispida TaxID=260671 RepID=A0AAJ0H5A2_9PEZI|nr:hypothetical protein B0T25DRAFT_560728 [Lasiosphaeria hispida]
MPATMLASESGCCSDFKPRWLEHIIPTHNIKPHHGNLRRPPFPSHPKTPSFTKRKNPSLGQPDLFDALPSNMTLVHSILIRALNSIYLQAPHIALPDVQDFCRYILTFPQLSIIRMKKGISSLRWRRWWVIWRRG